MLLLPLLLYVVDAALAVSVVLVDVAVVLVDVAFVATDYFVAAAVVTLLLLLLLLPLSRTETFLTTYLQDFSDALRELTGYERSSVYPWASQYVALTIVKLTLFA